MYTVIQSFSVFISIIMVQTMCIIICGNLLLYIGGPRTAEIMAHCSGLEQENGLTNYTMSSESNWVNRVTDLMTNILTNPKIIEFMEKINCLCFWGS